MERKVLKYFLSFNYRLYTPQEWVNHCVQKFGLPNSEMLKQNYTRPELDDEFKKVMVPNWEWQHTVLKEIKRQIQAEKFKLSSKKVILKKTNCCYWLSTRCTHENAAVRFEQNGKDMCDLCCLHKTISECSQTGIRTCVSCGLDQTKGKNITYGYDHIDDVNTLGTKRGYNKSKKSEEEKANLNKQKLKSKILKELKGYGHEQDVVQECFEVFTTYLNKTEKTTRGKPRKQLIESCFYIVLGYPPNYTGNLSYVEQVEAVLNAENENN